MSVIRTAILTLSDKGSRGEREDTGGPLIREMISGINAATSYYEVIPDDRDLIKKKLIEFSDKVDLIITTGGTGLSPRDVAPDATLEVIEKEIPGIGEAMRRAGLQKTARAMLSRAVAGVRGKTLIINLPGSPKAVKEGLDAIMEVIPHAIEKIKGDESDCAVYDGGII